MSGSLLIGSPFDSSLLERSCYVAWSVESTEETALDATPNNLAPGFRFRPSASGEAFGTELVIVHAFELDSVPS
jgi:hypothetical protein